MAGGVSIGVEMLSDGDDGEVPGDGETAVGAGVSWAVGLGEGTEALTAEPLPSSEEPARIRPSGIPTAAATRTLAMAIARSQRRGNGRRSGGASTHVQSLWSLPRRPIIR